MNANVKLRAEQSLLAVMALAVVVASTGCGGPSGGEDAGTGTDGGSTQQAKRYLCERDPALLAKGADCLWDDACPCGAYCELGACRFDCQSDAECGDGKVCDGFGRCATVQQAETVARPLEVQEQVGRVELDQTVLRLDSAHPLGAVTLKGVGVATGELRVEVAAGPIEVRCAADGAFAKECRVDTLLPDATRTLHARVVDPAASGGPFEVRIYSKDAVQSVHVYHQPSTAPAGKPLEGVYRGFARPVAFGSSARTIVTPAPNQVAEIQIPVEATIYTEAGNKRVVELSDELQLVFPDPKTVGELLRASNGDLLFRHNKRAFVGAGVGGSAQVDVAVSAESLSVQKGTSALGMTLRSRYAGVLDTASDPYVHWQLSLVRVGDLPSGAMAPALPSAYANADVTTRAQAPLAAETEVDAALSQALAALPSQATNAEKTEAVICAPYGSNTAPQLDTVIRSPWSGDVGCTSASMTPAQQLHFGMLKESTWQLADTLTRCMADLNHLKAVNDGTAAPAPSNGCLDGARAIASLRYALDLDRRRALGEAIPSDATASALGHRTLQLWLHTHLFVARQSTQVDLLNDVLSNEAQIDRGFQQLDMLKHTARGFDLLLHPRLALPISRMPPSVLFAPDYRPLAAPGGMYPANVRHDQRVGLPATLVSSMNEALEVYARLYERARYVPTERPALEASAAEFMRKSLVLTAMASALYDTTRANNPAAPSWEPEWKRSMSLYGVGLAGLQRSIENLREGRNPLDIDDRLDLPLYRIGDQTGSIEKFSAVSDYLLGTGTSLDDTAIVPKRILAAEAALEAARTAWSANLNRDFLQEIQDTATDRRLEAIRRRYGEEVTSLCGHPDLDPSTVLSLSEPVSGDECFVSSECRRAPADQRRTLAPGEVAFTLCAVNELRVRLGAEVAGPVLTNAFTSQAVKPMLDGVLTVKGHTETGSTLNVQWSDGTQLSVPVELFDGAAALDVPALTPEEQQEIVARCSAVQQASEAPRPGEPPEACALNGECPIGYFCDQSACKADVGTEDVTACYTGALGEVAASIRSSALDVEIARSELDELSEAYDIQMRKCIITSLGNDAALAAIEQHNQTMSTLAQVKLAADVAANAAAATKDCASTAAGDTTFGVASGVACGAAAVEAAAESVSDGMEFEMEETEREHELTMAKIEAETEEQVCFTEAEMSLVGSKTAVLRIQQAHQEMARQLVEFENMKGDVEASQVEGREALAAEEARTISPIALEYWLDEKVETYNTAFRAARRAAYLGVLAVEYEYQLSTPERLNVLAATKVSELRQVLERLRNLVATGTVKGRLPADLNAVVSLRDHLLQLASTTQLPKGWHTLSEAERLQLLLTSPRFAVYGRDGQYLGQEVPFQVAPLSTFKLGATHGVALLSGQDCAERVWSVNAALVGTDVVNGDATTTRVTLKKRNKFFSQWCGSAPMGRELQDAATRPSRNLFLDPFSDYVPGSTSVTPDQATVSLTNEADAFTAARLQPALGVSRADFENPQYFNGSSRELAGRGLYGDYALFFPEEILARDGKNGLRLERLEDVLLRFDYVSVAQN